MGENKRLILPAFAAIILHGLLFSCHLQKQPAAQVVSKEIPINIEIHAVSQKKPVPQKTVPKKETIREKKILPLKIAAKQPKKTAVATPHPPKKEHAIALPETREKKQILEEEKIPPMAPVEIAQPYHSHLVITELPATNSFRQAVKNTRQPKTKVPLALKKAVPQYQQNKQPSYPVMAKRRGYEGEVLLEVLVDIQGRVAELKIKNSCGHISLDRAALKAVKTWLFIPATEGNRAVPMWVDVPIDFQLKYR